VKILYITPHLSTGGAPQYLLKKIQELKDVCDIYCVEYTNLSNDYIVQKNQIKEILGNKLITLGDDKTQILPIIDRISPDIIHFEEFCNPRATWQTIQGKHRLKSSLSKSLFLKQLHAIRQLRLDLVF